MPDHDYTEGQYQNAPTTAFTSAVTTEPDRAMIYDGLPGTTLGPNEDNDTPKGFLQRVKAIFRPR